MNIQLYKATIYCNKRELLLKFPILNQHLNIKSSLKIMQLLKFKVLPYMVLILLILQNFCVPVVKVSKLWQERAFLLEYAALIAEMKHDIATQWDIGAP